MAQNRDYINKTRSQNELNKLGEDSIGPVDRQKLKDDYNKKLLDQLENLSKSQEPSRQKSFLRS